MEVLNLVKDTYIIAVNRGKQPNVENSLLYRDCRGNSHTINFEVCASNFRSEQKDSSTNCIGERSISQGYFLFYTSGIKTKVLFEKKYVRNIFFHHLLKGSRRQRFWQLQKLIAETKYVTYDLD